MRKNLNRQQKAVVAVAAGALGVAGSGIAFAYWTTSGSGTGSAAAAASNGVLTLSAVQVAGITPGTSYPVAIKAGNAGTTDLRVGSVSTVVTTTDVDCQAMITASTSGLSFAAVDTSGVNVAAGASDVTIGTGSLVWANAPLVNQDACKSAPFVLTFTGTSTSTS